MASTLPLVITFLAVFLPALLVLFAGLSTVSDRALDPVGAPVVDRDTPR